MFLSLLNSEIIFAREYKFNKAVVSQTKSRSALYVMILYRTNVTVNVTSIVILHLRYVVALYPPVNDLRKIKMRRYSSLTFI